MKKKAFNTTHHWRLLLIQTIFYTPFFQRWIWAFLHSLSSPPFWCFCLVSLSLISFSVSFWFRTEGTDPEWIYIAYRHPLNISMQTIPPVFCAQMSNTGVTWQPKPTKGVVNWIIFRLHRFMIRAQLLWHSLLFQFIWSKLAIITVYSLSKM